jgi:AraC-like DNA-binding protein
MCTVRNRLVSSEVHPWCKKVIVLHNSLLRRATLQQRRAACAGRGEKALQQRDKKLIDVARSVGYESDAAFSKAFKRVVGANPGEYLKRGFEGHGHAGMAEDF